jgi:Putative peptidoglycan binding domain
MHTQTGAPEKQIIAGDVTEAAAIDAAELEGDECGHAARDGGAAPEEAQDLSGLDASELAGLDQLGPALLGAAPVSLSVGQLLRPGGGFAGAEAPVRRAIRIGVANGLTVTSTKRTTGNPGSDHHVNQTRSFAADMSNGSSPTPQMDATVQAIAAALGQPSFRAGVLNVTHGAVRAQLLWRTTVGGNHFNHVHFGVRVSGTGVPGAGPPRLTDPHMSGQRIRRIQRRLVTLGFGPLDIDGIFGPQTDSAVRRFQQARGLIVDGVVGPLTRAALA